MLFSSLTFLFIFLPVVLGLYYLAPRNSRNIVLLAASLLFYAWGEVFYVLIMLFSIILLQGPITRLSTSDSNLNIYKIEINSIEWKSLG